jgi:hypothetical protein
VVREEPLRSCRGAGDRDRIPVRVGSGAKLVNLTVGEAGETGSTTPVFEVEAPDEATAIAKARSLATHWATAVGLPGEQMTVR